MKQTIKDNPRVQRSFRINKYQSKPTNSEGKNSDTDKKDTSFHSSNGVGKVTNVASKLD